MMTARHPSLIRPLALTLLLMAAWAAAGCVEMLEDRQGEPGEIGVSFALSLKNVASSHATTKMSGTIVQSLGKFRGIDEVYVVPFRTEGGIAVSEGVGRLGSSNVTLQDPGINKNGLNVANNSHFYDAAIMPRTMNRVLVYGKATDEPLGTNERARDGKHRNGVLNPSSGFRNPSSTNDISFSLEPIVNQWESSTVLAIADDLIYYLNQLVEAIQESGEPTFQDIFDYSKDQIFACSYQTFRNIYEDVSAVTFAYYGPGSDEIDAAIDNLDRSIIRAGNDFPAYYGIPEGSIGLWWNGKEFRRLISGVNIDLVMLGNFCYPPSLWYFANSPVVTSDNPVLKDEYLSGDWNEILAKYQDGSTVIATTHSVAINDCLQYGVGLLSLSFSGNDVAAVRDCPLTGIIIGDQKDVDFEFKPKVPREGEEPIIRQYVYDVIEDGPKLGAATQTSVPTLVLQTADADTVHFALEFKNTTGRVLDCQQGDILPDCKFYLVGLLDPNVNDGSVVRPSDQNSVFRQDRRTTVRISVQSLNAAYNTVPDLYAPQLEVGIVAEMDWVQIDPQSVKLNL